MLGGERIFLESEDILAHLHLAVSHQFKVKIHVQLILKNNNKHELTFILK